MSDSDIVEALTNVCETTPSRQTEYKHVLFEDPLGSAQIEYFARCDQWVPRSCVLRCLIQVAEHGEIFIKIDGRKLRLKQFGKLLAARGVAIKSEI
jgi:hypothetical protein